MDKTPEDEFGMPEERPFECSECKRPLAVRYTEVVKKTITHTVMCADCPQLQRRLHGIPHLPQGSELLKDKIAGLCCGNCGTSLESVQMGNLLGCSICYEVFEDLIMAMLSSSHKISPHVASIKKPVPLHMGKVPGEKRELSPALRLLALNEALAETLKKEDYEQAALLRDQIKELTENEKKEKKRGKNG